MPSVRRMSALCASICTPCLPLPPAYRALQAPTTHTRKYLISKIREPCKRCPVLRNIRAEDRGSHATVGEIHGLRLTGINLITKVYATDRMSRYVGYPALARTPSLAPPAE